MIGERIGNYVITQKLGEGGMGEVYLAAHPQIGKQVALKVLHPELSANEEVTNRFFHEAKAVNDISHPNIVDILDFGSLDTEKGNVVYLVMELLKGTTLTKVVAEGPLEPLRAVRIVRQVADALVASHERGIIHRDLKPDNVMLIARGREPEFVKLLDFGIAKVHGGTSKTRTGMVIGTPIYMSPEQCEGRGDIDHRTDVYALGTVLYELICGTPPFTGTGYAEILVKQLTETPDPVTQRRPGISRYLESIIHKALSKRREDRFQTMREMLEALSNPQEFVDARGGVAAFGSPRSNPPTGPQLPTPYTGAQRSHPPTGPQGTQAGYNTPYTPMSQPTPLHGQGMPTPLPTPLHGGMPTSLHGGAGMSTPMHGQGMPTPMHGQPMHGQPTPLHGQGMPTPLHGGAVPTPMPMPAHVPHQTTLSQGVGELGRAGRGTDAPPTMTIESAGASKKLFVIGGALAVAAIAAVVIVVMSGGDGAKNNGTSSQTATQPTTQQPTTQPLTTQPPTQPPPTQPPATQPPTTQPPATQPPTTQPPATQPPATQPTTTTASVTKIQVTTLPAEASVFVGSEKTERCKTPCAVEVPRGDGTANIVIKLAGYGDVQRQVSAKADIGLDLELVKKKATGTARPATGAGSGSAGKPKDKPLGDNTINPFDN